MRTGSSTGSHRKTFVRSVVEVILELLEDAVSVSSAHE
jgi:hypothetical protein